MIDDGYEPTYTIAWPLLRERRVAAVVGLIVSATDDPAAWKAKHPGSGPHLTWKQIDEMSQPPAAGEKQLVYIHSHTYDSHVNLRKAEDSLPPDGREQFHNALKLDLERARRVITEHCGASSKAEFLVWPHGGYSRQLLAVARDAGHVATFSDLGGAVRPGCDQMRIPRIHAGSGIRSLSSFQHSLDVAGW
jgi:peptidoglycan/xylan/chitin deacetylase (PgdA/CDA1 family)